MKLAAISHLASERAPTGAEKSLAHLVEAFADRGHEIAVAVPGPWALDARMRRCGVDVVEVANRPCWLVQAGEQPLWKQALRYLRFRMPLGGTRRLMVWLDRFWPDVVYVNCLPQVRGAAAARALGLPVVWHLREILPPGRRRRFFARQLRRDASRIIAVSRAVADWVADEGLGERTTVIHNGCRVPGQRPDPAAARAGFGLPADRVLVGFFAQLIDHKGVFDLTDAAIRVMDRDPRFGVVFAGEGPAAEPLLAAIAGSNHADRFVVLPPQREVAELLAAVDIIAVPSVWPDPLPRSVMEAMAAGLPVVAADVGGVSEMVVDGETGLLVGAGDVAGLSAAIGRLAGDADLRARLGAAGRKRAAEDFSLQATVDAVEAVLADAAGGDGGRDG